MKDIDDMEDIDGIEDIEDPEIVDDLGGEMIDNMVDDQSGMEMLSNTPVRSPRIIEYDSDALNFLMNTLEDSYYENVISQINSAHLSEDAKRRLTAIADEYNKPIEIVITNLRTNRQLKSQINAFRESAKLKKVGLRRIDAINGFFEIMVDIENHYRLKLTRSVGGFERREEQTQRGYLHQEHSMNHQVPDQQKSGINRIIRG